MSAFLLKSTYERQETIPNIQPFYNTKKYLTNTKTTPNTTQNTTHIFI